MAEAQFWLSEGTVVGGRYRLEKPLGVGGYGITYRGLDTRLDRQVAVKEFYPGFCASRFADHTNEVHCLDGQEDTFVKGKDRFLQEAKTLVQLSNIPAIVRVNDYFEENGTAYLVMEYLDGKNLKQMASGFGGRIPPEILIPILEPAVKALSQVHGKGLIHRDISPDNIMMLEDGSVRLIDFGNARDTTDDKTLTMAMKQGFAPPEQYRTKGQGPWTDVYSLCATMYYCMTGKLPPQPMDRLTGAPFHRISEFGIVIDFQQEQAILNGMDLYVHKRIQNMDALWQQLYAKPAETSLPSSTMTGPSHSDEYGTTAKLPELGSYASKDHLEKILTAGIDHIRSICVQIYQKIKER